MRKNYNKKRTRQAIYLAGLIGLMVSFSQQAQDVYMERGDTKLIHFDENVDTVFISTPKVADYELVGERSLMIYAKNNGRTDLVALDSSGDRLLALSLNVDPVLGAIKKKVDEMIPDSQISLQKMGETYILSGTVPTEEDRDHIYQIVGEGIGAKRTTTEKKFVVNDSQSSGNEETWLEEVSFEKVINKLQLPVTNQVNVKLSIVEITKTFTDNVGIDWGTISGSTITPGTFRFVKFNADTLSALVHAIRNDSVARVLAEPNLSVLSGEAAEFLVGGEIPIVTSSSNGSSVRYKEFGIKLNVGAKVSSNKRIRLTLGEEVSNVSETFMLDANNSFPTFQTRRAKTTVELADGESFMLAGLISNNEHEELARLPFIGDIPILGALFRNARTNRSRGELVVVATVNLVKPAAMRDIVLPDFQRTSTFARFLNLQDISDMRARKMAQTFVEQGGFIQ